MSSSMKLASAAALIVAVGALAVWQLTPRGGSGGPSLAPTASLSPAPAATTGPPTPPLTETFTSDLLGMSVSYPGGWKTHPATEPWEAGSAFPWTFNDPTADFIYDSDLQANLFMGLASQPLGDESAAEWIERMLAVEDPEPCTDTEPVEVDGAQGQLATCNEPLRAIVADSQRGYVIFLYRSDDDQSVPKMYGVEFFKGLLDTVQL